jgi:hypothetical protein
MFDSNLGYKHMSLKMDTLPFGWQIANKLILFGAMS